MPEVKVDRERCTGCGMCVNFCPVDVFEMQKQTTASALVAEPIRSSECWACDTCVGQCPVNAITIIESREEGCYPGGGYPANCAGAAGK